MAAMTGFRRDLFRGTAEYYDRYRPPYPRELIDDLAERAELTGSGALLDLACGTGQLTFALHERFARTWAVDQEPDMTAMVAAKARGLPAIRVLTSSAEELDAPPASFDLITIGNAFHRLPRDTVAALCYRWLRPGGYLAMPGGGGPEENPSGADPAPWQRVLHDVLLRWRPPGRIPAGYERDRAERPDPSVLSDAGFGYLGKREFTVAYTWTADSLIGYAYSMSVLSQAALGDSAAAFEADLRASLLPHAPFTHRMSFAYELARVTPADSR
jgi:SAM-dependent methyltransferase